MDNPLAATRPHPAQRRPMARFQRGGAIGSRCDRILGGGVDGMASLSVDGKHMPKPKLTTEQREQLFAPLFDRVKAELARIAGGDVRVHWALRRKLAKELTYLERGTPAHRKRLKEGKYVEQVALCAICGRVLPYKNTELDRIDAFLGYTLANTRLVHHTCHIADQKRKKYT